ncbi:MAG: ABC transporter permease [Clostridium sp.]|nr:ABC transporter permease [Clostridium sp.]MCM1547263.1 ABC transporter permease [Ruminococcus sp.]
MKFLNLLKKELHELINVQLVIELVVTFMLLLGIGQMMSFVMDEASDESGTVNISDLDNTDFTQSIIAAIEGSGLDVKLVENDDPDRAKLLESSGCDSIIIIPNGFTESVVSDSLDVKCELELVSAVKTSSAMSTLSDKSAFAMEIITGIAKNHIMTEKGLDENDMAKIETPFAVKNVSVVKDKSAEINSQMLISLLQSQGMFIPIVIFMLVMFTSQMIISAISTEKIDKTLETLLSAPVSRISVLGAKMLAAAIIAVINAVVYMIGFYGSMGSALSGQIDSQTIGQALTVNDVMKELGLKIGVSGYVMIGLQMFMTIMICLAVALILGALVNDAKSAQTMLMPIMVLAMVPYLVSMIYDINLLPPVLKTIVYAIPFTHTFNAMNNIMFGNTELYWFGLAYQFVLFIICMFFALKIFTSDKIFTISLNFGQKLKLKKNIVK